VTQRVGRGIALLFHDRGTRRGEWSAARPGCNLPPGKTRYPFYRRLGGPQGRTGRAENLFPTGIRSRTVQPVASSCGFMIQAKIAVTVRNIRMLRKVFEFRTCICVDCNACTHAYIIHAVLTNLVPH
jgi:hypothetical protein